MDDQQLLTAFENADLPSFHHRDHVRVAWILLQRYPLPEALDRFVSGVRRLAAAKGAEQLYHETITWAYFLLIHERIRRCEGGLAWPDFVARNQDLMTWKPSILGLYYRPETLASDLARRVFLLPDRLAAGAPSGDPAAADASLRSTRPGPGSDLCA